MSAHWNGVKTPQVLLISIVSTLPVRRNRRFHGNPAKAVTGGKDGISESSQTSGEKTETPALSFPRRRE